MASNLKYVSANVLKTWLASVTTVPAANIGIAQAEHEEPTKFPGIRIVPRRFDFEASQESEADADTYADKLLVEVGTVSGRFELWLSDNYPRNRETHEQEVMDGFMSTELAPGVVVLNLGVITVGGLEWNASAQAAFELQGSEWREELVFDKKRRTFLDLTVEFPVYAPREGVYSIDTLVLALTEDLASDEPTEQVQVNDNPPPDILPYP